MDIIDRLKSLAAKCKAPDYSTTMNDAAEEIQILRRQCTELEALILRRASEKMSRRAA